MMLASSPLLTSWIFAPKEVDNVFVSFLNAQVGQRVSDIALFRHSLPPLSAPCLGLHPGMSCERHALIFLIGALARAFKLYAPLHLLLVLVSPERSFSRYLRAVLHSTLFLGLYCTLAWMSACVFFRRVREGVARPPLLIPTLASGLAIFAERNSRQAELAVYVAAYAVDNLCSSVSISAAASRGILIPDESVIAGNLLLLLPRLVTVSAVAILFHHNAQLPQVVANWLLRLR
jgi:hypothetical protein